MRGCCRGPARVPQARWSAGVLALIDRLPQGDGLCHTDLHPCNVIMTAAGPRIIDWACAVRAPAVFGIGRCHITLTELVADGADPEPSRAINAAVQSEYARLAGMSPGELTASMRPNRLIQSNTNEQVDRIRV